jgi:hypothetical protein
MASASTEYAMSCLTRFILRLPDEMKQLVFDHLAANQDLKYGHIERAQHVHFFAADMLNPLPPIHTIDGTLDPLLDWIDFAEEAIAKNAIFHLTTDFATPYPATIQQHARYIRHLSLTMKHKGLLQGSKLFDMKSVATNLPLIKTTFPNLDSFDLIVSSHWPKDWISRNAAAIFGMKDGARGFGRTETTRRMLEILEGIKAKKMLCVHDLDTKTWVWHG